MYLVGLHIYNQNNINQFVTAAANEKSRNICVLSLFVTDVFKKYNILETTLLHKDLGQQTEADRIIHLENFLLFKPRYKCCLFSTAHLAIKQ